jgi:threonine aldolase
VRKVFGGGMRQAGYMAVAGIYALQNNIERLKQDHVHAKQIGDAIAKSSFTKTVLPIETNIIIFDTLSATAQALVDKLKEKQILCYATAPDRIRFVVHLDITEEMAIKTIEIIKTL